MPCADMVTRIKIRPGPLQASTSVKGYVVLTKRLDRPVRFVVNMVVLPNSSSHLSVHAHAYPNLHTRPLSFLRASNSPSHLSVHAHAYPNLHTRPLSFLRASVSAATGHQRAMTKAQGQVRGRRCRHSGSGEGLTVHIASEAFGE